MSTFPSIDEIYSVALDLKDEAAREQYLQSVCGNSPAVMSRVRDLLENRQAADIFWSQLEAGTMVSDANREQDCQPDEKVGSYSIVRKLGEGGMGVVYHAKSSTGDSVALKLLKPVMNSEQLTARFQIEVEALRQMHHPGIAGILDSGRSADGRLYLVMEFVQGMAVTRYCHSHRVPLNERLTLFCDICRAVRHAHQKGVIHRDLKPANILVEFSEGRHLVHVIDFGIAKTLSSSAGPSVVTRIHGLLGTPMSMSPEQTRADSSQVDTRSDVYALGILLYELVADQTPFDRERLAQADYDSLVKMIREEDPLPPSRRFRGSRTQTLNRRIRNELDWIVAKAIAKHPARRYQSMDEFVADISRYLAGDPIQARPPSWTYRVSRFCARNRVAVGAAALIFLTLTAATAVSLGFATAAREAKRRSDDARREAVSASQVAQQHALQADESRHRAHQLLYFSEIHRASQAYEQGDISSAGRTLTALIPQAGEPDLRGPEWHILNNLLDVNHVWQLQVNDRARCCRLSPDQIRLAVATESGSVVVLDATDGTVLKEHRFPWAVCSVAWHPTEDRLAVALENRLVSVQQAVGVNSVCLGSDEFQGAVLAEQLVEELRDQGWQTFAVDRKRAEDLVFSSTGGQLITGGNDGVVRVWDIASASQVAELTGHERSVESLALIRGGHQLVSTGGDRQIYLWDLATSKEIRHFQSEGYSSLMKSVAATDDSRIIVGGNISGAVVLADGRSGHRQTFQHTDAIEAVCVLPNPDRILVTDRSGTVTIWNLKPREPGDRNAPQIRRPAVARWQAATSELMTAAVDSSGTAVFTGDEDGIVCAWKIPRLYPTQRRDGFRATTVDTWGRLVLAGAEPATVIDVPTDIDSIATALSPNSKPPRSYPWKAVAASSHSPRVVAATAARLVVLDLDTQKEVWARDTLRIPRRLAISPDGRMIAVSDFEEKQFVELISIDDSDSFNSRKLPARTCNTICFSPDGRQLAVGHLDDLRIYDVATGSLIHRLSAHRSTLAGVSYHPNGRSLVTVGHDREMHVWDPQSGQHIKGVKAALGAIRNVDHSSDGSRIAIVADDGYLRLFEAEELRPVLAVHLHLQADDHCKQVLFTDHDQTVCVRTDKKSLTLINAHPSRPSHTGK